MPDEILILFLAPVYNEPTKLNLQIQSAGAQGHGVQNFPHQLRGFAFFDPEDDRLNKIDQCLEFFNIPISCKTQILLIFGIKLHQSQHGSLFCVIIMISQHVYFNL
jgi:hypothetical protein